MQLHGEFADAGAISAEAQVHADVLRAPARAARGRPPLRLHADPEVPARQAAGETTMPVLSDRSRRHRDHRRGAPQPVRHARAQHAPRAAQRRVHGLHRHAADRRRGADPPASSATTSASTTSATPSRTAPPSRSTTRTASPSCSSSTRTSPTSSTELLEEAELDEDAEGQLARRFGREYTLLTRPERLRTVARDLVRHFVGRGLHRQGDVRRDRQGRRRAHVRPRAGGVGRAPGRATRRSTTRCRSWSGRGWPAASS